MDGVLVDGEPLHFNAFNRLLAEEGRSCSLERHKASMGTKLSWSEVIQEFALSQDPGYYGPRYDEYILAEYACATEPLPGSVALLRGLSGAGIPLALASSSRTNWVEACLQCLDLRRYFQVVVTGSDIEHSKPAPDIYLLAAERLGADPSRCLAFEDAPAGILSAKAAGMECWAVRTEYTRGLDLPGPDREFESLADVSLDEIVKVAA